MLVTLAPGAVASSLRYYDAAFFDRSACNPRNATFMQVYPPNQTTPAYVADNVQVCLTPNVQLIIVDAVKAG